MIYVFPDLHATLVGKSDRIYGTENVERSLNGGVVRQIGIYIVKDISIWIDGIKSQMEIEKPEVQVWALLVS